MKSLLLYNDESCGSFGSEIYMYNYRFAGRYQGNHLFTPSPLLKDTKWEYLNGSKRNESKMIFFTETTQTVQVKDKTVLLSI